jgi:hypothetical protein
MKSIFYRSGFDQIIALASTMFGATAILLVAVPFGVARSEGLAQAGPDRPVPAAVAPDPDSPVMVERRRLWAEQQRRIEEHQRAARAIRARPASRSTASLPSGTVQIPIDMTVPRPLAKPENPSAATSGPATGAPVRGGASLRVRAAAVPTPPACPNALPYPPTLPPMKTASILQSFSDISWHICMTDMGPKGLWVGPVELLRSPGDGWRPILYQAGLADIFVPYHNNPPARYYDLGGGPSRTLAPISQLDTGPAGFPIWLSNESFPTVAGEVRDRGIGWLCKGDTQEVRRARELVLWAVSDAGNYDNIIEFSFRDDGSIGFRTGNTGYNSPGSPVESHSHDSLWYVDMDLNGFPGDTASMLNHSEPYTANQLLAADQQAPIAVEGARKFQAGPFELVSLLIEDNGTQVFGQKLGYEFLPLQSLPTRHFGWQETWTQNDIYIARYRYSDTLWASPIANHQSPDLYLLPALSNEPVVGQDLVAWIKTAAHHAPTTEDWATPTFVGLLGGVTLTHWSGFRIEPHNLFPTNPLGAPARCGS